MITPASCAMIRKPAIGLACLNEAESAAIPEVIPDRPLSILDAGGSVALFPVAIPFAYR